MHCTIYNLMRYYDLVKCFCATHKKVAHQEKCGIIVDF